MGQIAGMSVDEVRNAIRQSNWHALKKSQRYLISEDQALRSDYEFIACPCVEACWCKGHACHGHYRVRETSFERFLQTYALLWMPPGRRDGLQRAVLNNAPFNGRGRKAIVPLQWLRLNWSEILRSVRRYDRCGLCDSSPPIAPRDGEFTLWDSKIWSQLLYDSVVPFDYNSLGQIRRAGYSTRDFVAMNTELFGDLRSLSDSCGLTIEALRNLDSPWELCPDYERRIAGQPLSRIIDKIFYSP